MVDENGEPLVVYRGFPKGKRLGNTFKKSVRMFPTKGVSGRETNKFSFYFSDNKTVAERYGENIAGKGEEYMVKEYFLNIKSLFKAYTQKNQDEISFYDMYDLATKDRNPLLVKDWQGDEVKFVEQYPEFEKIYNSRHFLGSSKDVMPTFYYFVDWSKKDNNQNFWREYLHEKLKYDGIVFYERTHNASYNKEKDETIPEFGNEFSKTYGAFEPNQIKLADGTNTTFDPNNDDIRYAGGGTLLLAPNRKPSNLTTEQYKLVRTPKFKAWFGDWENDPENASKVVDENGEPLVVYHGTKNEFYKFNIEKQIKGWLGKGFYFSRNKEEASDYGSRLLFCFLNLKNPFIVEGDKVNLDGTVTWALPRKMQISNKYGSVDENIEITLKLFKNDGIIEGDIITAFEPNQIKLADGTNTTFDPNNDDIRYRRGGRTLAQTLAPSKERIYGSDRNKPRSSKDSSSAESIKFDNKTLTSIENKVEKHNEEHPDKKVNLATAKAVVRRGMGAYSKSHRPTISGGQPNSRVAWGLARLNAFLYKVVHGVSKSGKYSQDNDLLDELGIAHKKFADGGKIPKKNKGGDCYVVAGRIALNNRFPDGEKPKFVGEPYVIHAQVTGQGAIAGLKYGHAWVEDDDFVYEYSNGRDLKVPKKLYYKISQVIKKQPIYFKYTFEEARKKMAESGHFGSWDLITESGL